MQLPYAPVSSCSLWKVLPWYFVGELFKGSKNSLLQVCVIWKSYYLYLSYGQFHGVGRSLRTHKMQNFLLVKVIKTKHLWRSISIFWSSKLREEELFLLAFTEVIGGLQTLGSDVRARNGFFRNLTLSQKVCELRRLRSMNRWYYDDRDYIEEHC